MKKAVTFCLTILLVGCATVGDYQAKCEDSNKRFSEMVECTKTSLSQDPRLIGNPRVKLYILKADQLVQMLNNKEITDIDARVVLQELYVRLKNEQNIDIDRIRASMPKTTVIITK